MRARRGQAGPRRLIGRVPLQPRKLRQFSSSSRCLGCWAVVRAVARRARLVKRLGGRETNTSPIRSVSYQACGLVQRRASSSQAACKSEHRRACAAPGEASRAPHALWIRTCLTVRCTAARRFCGRYHGTLCRGACAARHVAVRYPRLRQVPCTNPCPVCCCRQLCRWRKAPVFAMQTFGRFSRHHAVGFRRRDNAKTVACPPGLWGAGWYWSEHSAPGVLRGAPWRARHKYVTVPATTYIFGWLVGWLGGWSQALPRPNLCARCVRPREV